MSVRRTDGQNNFIISFRVFFEQLSFVLKSFQVVINLGNYPFKDLRFFPSLFNTKEEKI